MNDPSSHSHIQLNGRSVKESLISGPKGVLKLITIWDGNYLISAQLFGE